MTMSTADWIILGFVVFSAAGAAIAGFFHEAFKLVGLVVGYLVAAWQYYRLAAWFAPYLKSPWLGEIIAFLIIFYAVLIAAGFAGRKARLAMKKAGLSAIDRGLGGVLGLVRGVLVVAIVLTAVASFKPEARWLAKSELAPYFLVGGRAAIWLAPADLRHRFYQGLDYIRQARFSSDREQRQKSAPSK
ncbi:MAG TPA: CvpA family protein [Candidatus Acidoferrum sp.]|nr:CvpA family protein [Candidatus Acidoferrum sp.]